jgi:hypothetical protein
MLALAALGWCASVALPLHGAGQGALDTTARQELASGPPSVSAADAGAAAARSAHERPLALASDGGTASSSSLQARRDPPPPSVRAGSEPSASREAARELPPASVRTTIVVHRAAAREPTVSAVIRMAARAARSLDPERLRELARRARLAGLAPELRVSVERGFDQDLTSSSSSSADSMRAAVGDELRFAAALTFDLDRLLFAPEEVRLLSVERWLASDRRKLVSEVVRLYFQRRRLLREQADARAPDDDLVDSIREVEALIDALTGGEFAAALARARADD